MPTDTQDTTAALSQLATDIVDIIKGYKVMEKRADEDLRPIAQRLHALHETHATELMTVMDRMGGHPEDAGSMMGAVNQAVATGRDWFDTLDHSTLPWILTGEQRLLHSYDGALAAAETQPELQEMLLDQRAAVAAQIDALRKG
jgi:uncharacterized protein (TIGR02284 family)